MINPSILPLASPQRRKEVFASERFQTAKGMLHISDAHLGMYFIEDDDNSSFENRLSLLRKKLKDAGERKSEILQNRIALWEEKREKGENTGGILSFNDRITQAIDLALDNNLLVNLNGDIFELVKKNTSGTQAVFESQHFRNEIIRYFREMNIPVLFTAGNHDERNLHRENTQEIFDFLNSESVLVMPKIWYDDRAHAVVTHGDFPNYRQDCLSKTEMIMNIPGFLQKNIHEQIALILENIDTEDPKGPQGIADGIIGTLVENFVECMGKKKAISILEKLYLERIFRHRNKRGQRILPKFLKKILAAEFAWMDALAQMNSEIWNVITGHTHFQQINEITTERGDHYFEANSGALLGSAVKPPSVLVVEYKNEIMRLLEWGSRKKKKNGEYHKKEGTCWKEKKEVSFAKESESLT